MRKPRIAIIGAGFSGLTLATQLRDVANCKLFEKARGVGGRMSTRYADPHFFDHGTQFFTARTESFQQFLAPHLASGLVAEWSGKVINRQLGEKDTKRMWYEPHYVACPMMNSLCKHMAAGLDIAVSTEIAPLGEKGTDGWHLVDTQSNALGAFDWVISTAPPVQTQRLFAAHGLPDMPHMADVKLLGCYTMMLGWNAPWKHAWIGTKIVGSPIEWIAVNSSKPQRNNAITSLVIHSSNRWAEDHIDDDMESAQAMLMREIEALLTKEWQVPEFVAAHRWRYAIVENPQAHAPYCDEQAQRAAVGDWCAASRIEDVWSAAMALSRALEWRLRA